MDLKTDKLALQRLKEAAEQAKRDESQAREGHNPDRARQWVTWTDDEGAPNFTDD